ncbi:MAG: hypothetical protein IPI44_04325 [Sulfuritalea sp.]|nr:hypothetical protein [Sulfuritalea sp.]
MELIRQAGKGVQMGEQQNQRHAREEDAETSGAAWLPKDRRAQFHDAILPQFF